MQNLTVKQARQHFLHAQALRLKQRRWSGKNGLVSCIKHLGYVQIDTISAVERAHHHVLWTRVKNYEPAMLNTAQAIDRSIIEYWSHAAAYLPMQDYRFSLPRKRAFYDKYHSKWTSDTLKVHEFVLDRIKAEGELAARDFEAPPNWQAGNWFEWKPAKQALERLFHIGEIVISKRIGFQKYFDLPERVIPEEIDTSMPDPVAEAKHLLLTQLRAQGVASQTEIAYLRGRQRQAVKQAVAELLEESELEEVKIYGLDEPYYAIAQSLAKTLRSVQHQRLQILSPFDNLVIQRRKLARLFDYDFTIECYVPEVKRRYGYFCLPLLYKSEFVGRVDAKADRKSRCLLVKSLWIEFPNRVDSDLAESLAAALVEFAAFNNCDSVELLYVSDSLLKKRLQALLAI